MVAIAFVITGRTCPLAEWIADRLRVYHNVGLVVWLSGLRRLHFRNVWLVVWLRGLRRLRIHNDVRLRVYYNVGLVMLKG